MGRWARPCNLQLPLFIHHAVNTFNVDLVSEYRAISRLTLLNPVRDDVFEKASAFLLRARYGAC